jgi:hypothetical protein
MTLAGSSPSRNVDVQLTLTDIGATLQGTVHYSVLGTDGQVVKDGRILFASRDSTVYPSRFEGQWVGFVTRTQCSGDCSEGNDPVLQSGGVRVVFSQSGGVISGRMMNGIELTGTANGNTLHLSSRIALDPPVCQRPWDGGMTCQLELSVSGSADTLDRLHGSVTYRAAGFNHNGRPYALNATGTLDGLARWP